MKDYNYYESVKEDIKEYLRNTDERDEQKLYDEMFIDDSVTGNGSGSYTFSTYEAEENLCHNMDLLQEALAEFGDNNTDILQNPEACDVTIRCYLLGQLLSEALEEIEEEEEEENEQ